MKDYKNISENILFYAFRYALGRRTYAVEEVVDMLLDNWNLLTDITKEQLKREIRDYSRLYGEIGDKCDSKQWRRILDKEITKWEK